MSNLEKAINIIKNEQDELYKRAKIVIQYIELRERLGYSQQDVANIMGVSKQLISRFERMEHSPSLPFLVNYAKALNADIDTILSLKNVIEISLSNDELNKMNNTITYKSGEIIVDVNFDYENETVWLNQNDIASLFDTDRSNISRHIKNILEEGELDNSCIIVNKHSSKDLKHQYKTNYYNLDMIISIGYRVNSKRGIEFRKWVLSILKDYIYKGVSINEKRLEILNKTIEIQNKLIRSTSDIESYELVSVINEYTKALDLLDNYDHQVINNIKGRETIYRISYQECRKLIDSMKFNDTSSIFGVEKEEGKLEGIIEAVYQNVFGTEVYKTLESKAAHLLYFLVKDHPFIDGCKRIAATIFLEFLNKNNALMKNGKFLISNDALCAITLLIAESNPSDMELVLNIVMNLLEA